MIKGPIGKILSPEAEGTGLPGNAPDQLRPPTLDERAKLYLRAIHGERDFTDQEHAVARDRLLGEMAANIAAESVTDRDLPGRPQDRDFDRVAVAAASFRISDEYQSLPEASAQSADYCADEAPPTDTRLPPVVPLRSVPLSQSTYRSPSGHVDIRSFSSISRSHARPQLTESRPRPAAKRRIFMAAAAIAATLLLVAGAYRLVLLPTEETKSLHTAFRPIEDDSRVQFELLQACPGSSNDIALRQNRIESCPEVGQSGPARPSSQNSNTALLRAPNSPLAASSGDPKNAGAIADMVQRGQALMASGNILAARFVLKEAADRDSADAALALGMTYDPVELENLGVRNLLPEADAARRWYQKAKDLGSTEAQLRLDRLGAREERPR
jgi:hypothetical protein